MKHCMPLVKSWMLLAALVPSLALANGTAKGTIVYKDRTVTVKHAYLVKGPDAMTKQPARKIILSVADQGKAIAKCQRMMCLDGDMDDGLSIALDIGPRFGYWMVLNGQKIQYSGTAELKTITFTQEDAKRLAGKVVFDASKAGGPKVDIEFDAPLVKEVGAL